jgi:mitogen-activated protein kinase kinase kinase 7
VLQTAEALQFLHTIKPLAVLHRDIKSQNILLFDNYETVKLADFGLATIQRPEMTNQRGTTLWMAPEVSRRIYYNTCSH